jgi:hypothetical protein
MGVQGKRGKGVFLVRMPTGAKLPFVTSGEKAWSVAGKV